MVARIAAMRPYCLVLLCLCFATSGWAQNTLRVYSIDVEGGKSTLYVSPSGETMLVDAGYAGHQGRDVNRILRAAKDAGVTKIDYLVVTHFHQDHMGGVPAIAAKLPVAHFIDHGKNFETVKDTAALLSSYTAVRDKSPHTTVKAGDTIPIRGIAVEVVTAAGVAIESPLPGQGQPNPLCASYKPIEADTGENAHSIGMVITFGNFRMVDLGDLYWNQEHDLACPVNKIGPVDVYMTTHHGTKTSGSPQMVHALHPRVAIMNNGPTKGGSVKAWETIESSPGLIDLWQLHYSLSGGKEHNVAEQFIANPILTPDQESADPGEWIKMSAQNDGTFTVENNRNHFQKTYPKN